jgi:hypothetical protein
MFEDVEDPRTLLNNGNGIMLFLNSNRSSDFIILCCCLLLVLKINQVFEV